MLSLAAGTVLFSTKLRALLAIMVVVLFLTQGQQIDIFGFNMYAARVIELVGFLRVVSRREISFANLTAIDRAFIALYLVDTLIFQLRAPTGKVNHLGYTVDALLSYFAFRGLLGSFQEVKAFFKAFVLLLAPYTLLILYESFTRRNPFLFMGGIDYGDWLREGRIRCQGSFRHPSLLGSLGASFFPLYFGLWLGRVNRGMAVLAIFCCLAIVWASNSGGPANCVVIAIAGWTCWKARKSMKLIKRLLLVVVVVLSLIMKAPIWYLPAKLSSISGGDGWHRSFLMDVSFRNFSHWWLVGMPLENTRGWFPYDLDATGGADITNQFISFALNSGILTMILFIFLLYIAYRELGRALDRLRSSTAYTSDAEWFMWGAGVMLTVHIFNWMGITYFDQFSSIWFMQLAIIASLAAEFASHGSETGISPNLYDDSFAQFSH